MSKTFTHAGVSKLDGEFKARFANDSTRVKVLIKNGHTDIDIIELKHPMTKEEAVQYLLSIDFATQNGVTNADVKAALEAELDKRTEKPTAEKAAKEPKAPKEKKPKAIKAKAPKAAPTMEGIKAKVAAKKAAPKSTVSKAEVEKQLAELENAPF